MKPTAADHAPDQAEAVDDARFSNHTAADRYEVHIAGQLAALITYRATARHINMIHTETKAGFEGHGLATALARFALQDAREQGLKVIPTCPFVAAYIRAHQSEYLDLVLSTARHAITGPSPNSSPLPSPAVADAINPHDDESSLSAPHPAESPDA